MDRILYIMRGLPGSGKSTIARRIAMEEIKLGANAVICSTDQFFVNDQGIYVFDGAKLGSFHLKNQARVEILMGTHIDSIIVDNVNTTLRDMEPYIEMASSFNYHIIKFVAGESEMKTDLENFIEICAQRNEHNVPLETIERMARQFEWEKENG